MRLETAEFCHMKTKGKRPVSVVVLLLMVVSSIYSACWAGGWTYEPFASAALTYDDNVRLTSANEETSTGGEFEVGVELMNDSEVSHTVLRPRFRFNKYASEGDLDTNELFLTLSTSFQGERSTLGLSANLNRESSISTELQDTGNVAVNRQRNLVSVSPQWRYRLSPRNTIDLGGVIQSVRWPDDKDNFLNEYNNNEVSIGFTRALSPLLEFKSKAYQKSFDSIETGFEAATTGVDVGLSRKFSERTQGSFSVGGWRSDLTNDTGKDQISGASAKLDVQHQTTLANVDVRLVRDLVPSSLGDVREDTKLGVGVEFRATEKMSWGMNGSWQQSSTAGGLVSSLDRTYYEATPYLAWRLNRQLRLKASFQITQQDIDQSAGKQNRNKLFVSLEYRQDKRFIY